jgi:hypothetical protein
MKINEQRHERNVDQASQDSVGQQSQTALAGRPVNLSVTSMDHETPILTTPRL